MGDATETGRVEGETGRRVSVALGHQDSLKLHCLPLRSPTLLSLLRISIFCHFGSTSFVLPIQPKNSILNRDNRVLLNYLAKIL